ncbi:MAG: FAD-dependent oxidoreductase [Cyanobacteria bacterium PR.3.49]|nr:FAD-dependent oxidoreductase [Cyanobacteria bacterium PR.3.49]
MIAKIKERAQRSSYDAIVIGSGVNGLSAAITLVSQGMSVLIVEGQSTIGGACRSLPLTLPGFSHDICSSIYPLGVGSPFFRSLPLQAHGLKWIHPDLPFAHPFEDGKAALFHRSIEKTADGLGLDSDAYKKLFYSLNPDWDEIAPLMLKPPHLLRYPFGLAHFGMKALMSASVLGKRKFKTKEARALLIGVAAHSALRMDAPASAAFALVLSVAGHLVGWPFPEGGAQSLTNALISYFQSLGGEILIDAHVESISELPQSHLILCDITPRQLLEIAADRLPGYYKQQLQRFTYGPGSFKIDWALDAPVPWKNEDVARAGTVHIGGTLEEIADAEAQVVQGKHPERPYVLLAQTSLFDRQRAPQGKHTLWGYCHVPNGSTFDMTERIEEQIERVAPGFGKIILKRSVLPPQRMQEENPNHIGGDINGGALSLGQLFARPSWRAIPYSTPVPGLYLCSSSTPPGGGVHGMPGYYAAQCAIHNWRF